MDGTQAELYPKTDSSRRRFGAKSRAKGSFRMSSQPQASMKMKSGRMGFIRDKQAGCSRPGDLRACLENGLLVAQAKVGVPFNSSCPELPRVSPPPTRDTSGSTPEAAARAARD